MNNNTVTVDDLIKRGKFDRNNVDQLQQLIDFRRGQWSRTSKMTGFATPQRKAQALAKIESKGKWAVKQLRRVSELSAVNESNATV
jgi:hypothetical protein